jgi:hypothetical protein
MLPTSPVKNPTMGPKAIPKNGTSAYAGRTETLFEPGMTMLMRNPRTP